MRSASSYLHGTSPSEQDRLALLNRLVNRGSIAELDLRGGERVLEMGSGLGHFAREMARQVGRRGWVLGIERSARQLNRARRSTAFPRSAQVEFRRGDALSPPLGPGEWGSFHVAHARFLLEHLKEPLLAVRQMVRAVRPGGRIVLEDDDHDVLRLHPPPAGFSWLWRAYMRSFRVLGNDPDIGRKLPALLQQAGARPTRNSLVFFGSCAGQRDFPLYLQNLIEVLTSARKTLLARDLITPPRFAAAMRSLRGWGKRPDAAIFYSIAWAEGRRPR
ncbi:MAG: methyltransferase domain-containing protein [Acidobacteria bacterium]|nr:methyltransferase domain-containing protein [Acidobacteriota bacterium]